MRYLIRLDYEGTAYSGWQVQPGLNTVQGRLEKALYMLTGERVKVTGSGRTDAGVHALCQTAHFDLVSPMREERLNGGLNHYLPPDIRVQSVNETAPDFHARYDCREKSYLYLMYRAPERALLKHRALAVESGIDAAAMNDAAALFYGRRDFSAFLAGGSDVKTTVRTVTRSEVSERGGFIAFEVSADGFLYNMVRIMTALLLFVGRGKLTTEEAEKLIESGDRGLIKGLAPACGLYLKSQIY